MILILTEEFDSTTNKVIDWIEYFGLSFIRINETSNLELSSLTISNQQSKFSLKFDNKTIDSDKIKSFWYRRGFLNNKFKLLENNQIENYNKIVNRYLSRENEHLRQIYYNILESKKSIGKINDNKINKLEVLIKAKDFGLDIPETIISNSKKDIINLLNKHNLIITKSVKDNIHLQISENEYYMQYTNLISKSELEHLPATFFPSIFQELIEKKFELRIFFLESTFYASAIFSQENDKTKVDFRRYDKLKPNRSVPFLLPEDLLLKLQNLMNDLGLISGSIDIIVSKKNKYYFLEVNPIGQFGQVSKPCNYFLEKKVAEYLSF